MAEAVRIKGMRELQRAFKRISKDLDRELTGELKDAAEPARNQARQLALGEITNMPKSPAWADMRVGVSRARGAVFIAPRKKGRSGRKRPNLGVLLLVQMERAVDEKRDQVARDLEHWIDRTGRKAGF